MAQRHGAWGHNIRPGQTDPVRCGERPDLTQGTYRHLGEERHVGSGERTDNVIRVRNGRPDQGGVWIRPKEEVATEPDPVRSGLSEGGRSTFAHSKAHQDAMQGGSYVRARTNQCCSPCGTTRDASCTNVGHRSGHGWQNAWSESCRRHRSKGPRTESICDAI
jgi:hypothetical protein